MNLSKVTKLQISVCDIPGLYIGRLGHSFIVSAAVPEPTGTIRLVYYYYLILLLLLFKPRLSMNTNQPFLFFTNVLFRNANTK